MGATAVVVVAGFAACEELVDEVITAGHGRDDQRTDPSQQRQQNLEWVLALPGLDAQNFALI